LYTFSKMNQIMHQRLFIAGIFFILSALTIKAQDIAIGEWRDHLPYKNVISVTASDENIYCATPYSLFYYNLSDNTITRITRITGLSDVSISKIGFSKTYNTLLVAYSNTNIDLIKGNTIINMRDIINSEAITPEEKVINNLLYIGNKAYLSCGFGIVVLDIDKEEISDTYFIGPNGTHLAVYDLCYNDTSFYAATENGIYTASLDDPNLAYFGSWSIDMSVPRPNGTYNAIVIANERILINKYSEAYAMDTLFYLENGTWIMDTARFPTEDILTMKVFDEKLYVVYKYFAHVRDMELDLLEPIWTYNYQNSPTTNDVYVEDNIVWIADGNLGLVKRVSVSNCTFIYPNGPDNADVFSMSAAGNIIYTVPGGRDLSWNNIGKHGSISYFNENKWKTYDRDDFIAIDSLRDILSVAVNPSNPSQVFAGSWSNGMIEIENGQQNNVYGPENSGLDYRNNEIPRCKVGGIAFDPSGNLWATSSHANNALSVRIPDNTSLGEWHSFNLGNFSGSVDLGPLMIDSYGQKWIITRETKPIIVFKDNGTITNTSDDQVKELTSAAGNGGIPGEKVYSMAEDKDGEVWIGTDAGIGVFYSPGNIFSTGYNFDAQRILIPRNDGSGLADILLEFETVTAIAVDGDNNKWIGTDRSGVFQLSPDGQQELHHFTEQNSPLFSNNITSIVITKNGEVFFGTSKGILSFRSTATPADPTFEDVYAFPNPVHPGYNGPIAIKGLVDQANFKITDISGTLIYSGKAEGGQAIWNGVNFSGRRAQSGVYLVFLSDDEGSEKLVTKILFIN
jgi:hypothetical protein